MADESGKLSREEVQKAVDWLKQFPAAESANCPLCGSDLWLVAEHLVQPVTLSNMSIRLGGEGYPLVMLISKPCGYTRFMNAVMMGLAPAHKSPSVDDKEKQS